jgi:hypothetical protein
MKFKKHVNKHDRLDSLNWNDELASEHAQVPLLHDLLNIVPTLYKISEFKKIYDCSWFLFPLNPVD